MEIGDRVTVTLSEEYSNRTPGCWLNGKSGVIVDIHSYDDLGFPFVVQLDNYVVAIFEESEIRKESNEQPNQSTEPN